jgi:hypothetical protein
MSEASLNLDRKKQIALVISLMIISIFPIFVTFAPQEWPLQPSVLLIDLVYLLILAGYLLVLTGRNRSRWLVTAVFAVSIIGVLAISWLAITLATLQV